MAISSIQNAYAIQYRISNDIKSNSDLSVSNKETGSSDRVSISPAAYQELTKDQLLSYDVTNLSRSDIANLGKVLLQNGQINDLEYATMTFDPSGGPLSIKNNKFINSNGNINYLAEVKSDIEFAKYSGVTNGIEIEEKILNILQNIDALRTAQTQ